MEPADLFQQAQDILKSRLQEAAAYEGDEAYTEAQPHVQQMSQALETARQQVAESMGKAKAAQESAHAQAAAAAAQAQAARDAAKAAAARAGAAPAVGAADIAFEDGQELEPKKVQE